MSAMKVLGIYFFLYYLVQVFQYGVSYIQNKCFNLAKQTW